VSRHAADVIATHQLKVDFVVALPVNGYAFLHSRRIEIAPINDAGTYLAFLHEAGHASPGVTRHFDVSVEIRNHRDQVRYVFAAKLPRGRGHSPTHE
jgi:hypothetical protein